MSKRKKKLTLDDPLRDIWRAINRLDKDQGAVARRNARKEVMAELRRLKAFVDREYPLKASSVPRKKRKRRTPREIYYDAIESGQWVEADRTSTIKACAEAGIGVKSLKWSEKRSSGRGRNYRTWQVDYDVVLVPEWADIIAKLPNTTISDLRRAKKSPIERDATIIESKVKAGIDPVLELKEAS